MPSTPTKRRELARRVTEAIDKPRTSNIARPQVIGITGPPGAGKSTLVDQLIRHYRDNGDRPGVIVVDPSSPLTGGALLGDRIRMQEHASDDAVYIRSLATRGELGGLAAGIEGVLDVLAEGGFSPLLIETVGVGQSEVRIASVADTVVLVLHPGWGDEIQAAKAGLLEIADVFFVNKADQGNANAVVGQIEAMLALSPSNWKPPVLSGSALTGDGVAELVESILTHRKWEESTLPEPQPGGQP